MRVDGSLQIPPRSSLIGQKRALDWPNCLPKGRRSSRLPAFVANPAAIPEHG
jgi:hypothetical protein